MLDTSGLTRRQRDLLVWIDDYIRKNEESPTYDEMCAGIGLASKNGINRLLTALQERGRIRAIKGRARSIVVVRGGEGLEDSLRTVLRQANLSSMARRELNGLLLDAGFKRSL